MKRLFLLILISGSTFGSVLSAMPAKAATWYLVTYATIKCGSICREPHFFTLPMESESQCEVAGSKLQMSGKGGKFDKRGVNHVVFECVKGK